MQISFVINKNICKTKHYSLGKIFKLVKHFDYQYSLKLICTLNSSLFSNRTDIELQDVILFKLFNESQYQNISQRLNMIMRIDRKQYVVFHRQQLLLLLKIILIYGNRFNGSNFNDTRQRIGKVLLSLNTHIGDIKALSQSIPTDKEKLLSEYIIPLYYFSHSNTYDFETVKHKIVRSITFWNKIYPELFLNGKFKFDYENDFKNLLNVSFKEYLYILFSIYVHFNELDAKTSTAENYFFKEDIFFKESKLELSNIKNVLNTCKLIPSEFQEKHSSFVKTVLKGKDNHLFNFLIFQDKPLLELEDGSIFPIDHGYFIDKVTNGIYWELNNKYKESDAKTPQRYLMPTMMGLIFEEYAKSILEAIFGTAFASLKENKKNKVADGIVSIDLPSGKKNILVVEIKHIRLSQTTMLNRDLDTSLTDFNKLFGQNGGVGQIYSTVKQLLNRNLPELDIEFSQIENIIPLIIASDFIPDDPLSRKFYEEEFINRQKDELTSDIKDLMLEPYVISIEELEMFEAIPRNQVCREILGILIERNQIIKKRNANGYHALIPSIKDVLIVKQLSFPNSRIHEEFQFFLNDLKDFLF